MAGIWDFITSNTVGLASSLIPLLSRAYNESKADTWIYDRIPKRWKENGTLMEFKAVLAKGKDFMEACWAFTHKDDSEEAAAKHEELLKTV